MAELSLRFGATEEVSTQAKKAAAGIAEVDASMKRASATAKQAAASFDQAGGNVVALSSRVKGLKEPISNVSQLANAMGSAFGGAASKATGLINGVVSGFAAGGPMGLAIGATTGLVAILISRFQEARAAAEKARQAAVDEQLAQAKAVEDLIAGADKEIATLKAKLGRGEDPATLAANAAMKEQEASARAAVAAAEENLARAQRAYRENQDERGRASKAAADEAVNAASREVLAAQIALDKVREQNEALRQRMELLSGLRREAGTPEGRAGGGGGGGAPAAGGRTRHGEPEGPTGDPLATRESTAAYLRAAVARARMVDKAVEDEQKRSARERARIAAQAERDAVQAANEAAERAKQEAAQRLADREAAEQAGLSFATSWAQAIKKGVESGDALDFLRGALGAVGQILSIVPGGGLIGGIVSGIGSVLRDGGDSHMIRVPKARRGIAIVGGMDSDGHVIEGHPGEVMLNAPAVARNGGIDRVAAQNNPLEPPLVAAGAGGPGISISLSALTPRSAREAVVEALEPVLGLRLRANQGKYTADLRRRLRRRAR